MAENSVYKEPPNFYSYWVKTMRTVITFQWNSSKLIKCKLPQYSVGENIPTIKHNGLCKVNEKGLGY